MGLTVFRKAQDFQSGTVIANYKAGRPLPILKDRNIFQAFGMAMEEENWLSNPILAIIVRTSEYRHNLIALAVQLNIVIGFFSRPA